MARQGTTHGAATARTRPDGGRGGPPRGPQHTRVRPPAAEGAARRTGAAGHAGPRHPAPEPPGVSGTPVSPAREALPGRGPDPHHPQRPAAGQPADPAGPGGPADAAAGEHIARAAVGLALADRPRGGPRLRRLLHRGETASRTDVRSGQRGAVALPRRECLPHRDPRADSHRRRVGLAGGLRDRLDVDGRHQLGHTTLGAAATPRYRRPGEEAQGGELHRPRLHLVPRDERRGEGADPVVRLRLLPAHAGRPGGTVAAGTDNRGGPAGPERPRGAADRHRQVALLPGPRPVGLRQDQRPHGGDLPAGGTDGRPAGRA